MIVTWVVLFLAPPFLVGSAKQSRTAWLSVITQHLSDMLSPLQKPSQIIPGQAGFGKTGTTSTDSFPAMQDIQTLTRDTACAVRRSSVRSV